MWKWFYETSSLLDLPVVAMTFFALTFTVVVGRALLGRRAHDDDQAARLPLLDDAPLAHDASNDAFGGRHG